MAFARTHRFEIKPDDRYDGRVLREAPLYSTDSSRERQAKQQHTHEILAEKTRLGNLAESNTATASHKT